MGWPGGTRDLMWERGEPGPRQRRAAATLRWTFALYVLASYGAVVVLAGGFRPEVSTQLLVLLGVLVVSVVLVQLRVSVCLSLLPLLFSSLVAAGLPVLGFDIPFVFGVLGFAVAVELRPKAAAVWTAPSALLTVALAWAAGTTDLTKIVDGLVLCVALTMTGSVYIDALARSVRQLDAVSLRRVETEAAQRIVDDEMASDTRFRRLVHDELIGTVRAVADARPEGEPLVRAACRAAVSAVVAASEYAHDVSLGDVVAFCVERSAVTVQVGLPDHDALPLLPPTHADAVQRALSEALRNVSRHSGVLDACVYARRDGDWMILEVIDHGVGSGNVKDRSWGLSHSIEAPIVALGGQVQVWSKTDNGTRVLMRWPVDGLSAARPRSLLTVTQEETLAAAGGDPRLAVRVALPVLMAHSYLGLRNSWGDPHAVSELVLGAACIVATLWLVIRLGRANVGYPAVTATALLAAVAVVLGLAMAEPDALAGYDSWIIGLVSTSLIMVAFFTPPAIALLSNVPAIATVAVLAVADGRGLGAVGALNAIVVPALLATLLGHYLRSIGRQLAEEEERLAQLTAVLHRQRVRTREEKRQLAYLERYVVPWLASTANALFDDGVREEARLLAAELRDELYIPGMLDDALRARIRSRRREGARIQIEAPDSGFLDVVGVSLRALDRILDIDDVRSVSLSLPTHDTLGVWRLATFPVLRESQLAHVLRSVDGLHVTVQSDGISSTITVRPVINSEDAR